MSTHTEIPSDSPIIVMTRFYSAPRPLVWRALTEPEHVQRWWGGAGCSNLACEMDVRPGGVWRHVMRLANGPELHLEFVFVEVEPPSRLVWQHADHGARRDGPPTSRMEVTLEELGADTRWTLVTRFDSIAARDAALALGFTAPIEASSELLAPYLDHLGGRTARLSGRPSALPPRRDDAGAGLHALLTGSFVPMLQSLRGWLDRGAEHTGGGAELPSARLAPDMYTLAQQVQLACNHARDALGRLSGAGPSAPLDVRSDLKGLHEQILATLAHLQNTTPAALHGAAERDCSIPTPDGHVIPMNGLTFVRAWALPHFYFHLVTAYDILRQRGVPLGKRDYLSQLAALLQPRPHA